MTDKETLLGNILSNIADELNISREMQEKAERSYNSVGEWLSLGIPYDVKIFPQGSMSLGTVVRPISELDEYDIDLVCLLKNGSHLPLHEIKQIVGQRLKAHGIYGQKLDDEGKRCWTMQYAEFHMDILPSVPKDSYYIEPYLTGIKLTHKVQQGQYEPRFSNPYAYHEWFEGRMANTLYAEKLKYASAYNMDIAQVPTYKVRTPLQKCVQLLKRHRDIYFQADSSDAPISIIITTLVALSYNGETNVYTALLNILNKMPQHIYIKNGKYWIENPVMHEENFADKWNESPSKALAFNAWLIKAKEDLINDPLSCYGIDAISERYKNSLGHIPVERAVKNVGYQTRNERERSNLYMNGLLGGVSTCQTSTSKPINGHTFYGK